MILHKAVFAKMCVLLKGVFFDQVYSHKLCPGENRTKCQNSVQKVSLVFVEYAQGGLKTGQNVTNLLQCVLRNCVLLKLKCIAVPR